MDLHELQQLVAAGESETLDSRELVVNDARPLKPFAEC
jgi:hypothetical protein